MSLELSGRRTLMTGGTGLASFHLTAHLSEDDYVVVADDLSKEGREQVPSGVEFVQADMTDPGDVAEAVTEDLSIVFHFAAYTDMNYGSPQRLLEENTEMTYNVLERIREVSISDIAFTFSSTTYSEAPRPTPEDYAPLEPISIYGSSKLADGGPLSTFAHSYDFTVCMYRFANIVGLNRRGNVIPDFIEELLEDPETPEILGNGHQEKSYLHAEDCIGAVCHVVEHADRDYNTYNLGTQTITSVTTIVNIVADMLDLDPEFEYTGGGRGWTGDIPKMHLSIGRLSAFGQEPDGSSDETVRHAAEELATEFRTEYE